MLPVPSYHFYYFLKSLSVDLSQFCLVGSTDTHPILIICLAKEGPTWWTVFFQCKKYYNPSSHYHHSRFLSCKNFLLLYWWSNRPLSPADISVSLTM